jgi:putative CocE/NonD family hydrolase
MPVLRKSMPLTWEMRVRAWAGGISVDHGVQISMPDGVRLANSLYLPRLAEKLPVQAMPTVYVRLPYDRLHYEEALRSALWFARNDYVVLVQDVRGKFGSEGQFAPWEHATSDGVATLEWITRQPWSNGKVGTFGCSALGEMQYSLARAHQSAHAAMIASGAGGAWGSPVPNLDHSGFYEGGVLQLASTFGWSLMHGALTPDAPQRAGVDIAASLHTLPLQDMMRAVRPGQNVFTDYLHLAPDDPGWRRFDLVQQSDTIDVPALVINTWGDQTIEGTLSLAEKARRESAGGGTNRQHVIIAPGNHCDYIGTMTSDRFGDLEVRAARRPYGEWFLRWFEYHLRGVGDGLAALPPYQFFVIGENRWLSAAQWPPQHSRTEQWFLGSAGHANSRQGNGTLARTFSAGAAFDEFVSDPMNPVPSRGGPICCTGNPADVSGPADQADVERRDDVLVYTSAPLDRPMRIAGSLRARLRISSTAPDADFIVRLVHLWPDGRATSIQEGALRARYREGPQKSAPLKPAGRYTLTVPMRSIAYFIPAGHRIRVDIAGSSFPRLERNLQTGGNNYDESAGQVARNTVHHSATDLSFLELPVLDDEHAVDVK